MTLLTEATRAWLHEGRGAHVTPGAIMVIRWVASGLLLVTVLAAPAASHAKGAGATASAGLSACHDRPAGKAVRDCVADVLDQLAARNAGSPQRQAELQRAASGLRAAADKAQALLALTQCQNVISAAFRQASAGGGRVRGLGSVDGLGIISGILTQAIRLIQNRG